MKTLIRFSGVALVIIAATALVQAGQAGTPKLSNVEFVGSPLVFVPNAGQTDSKALYYARGDGGAIWLVRDGLVFGRTAASKLIFRNANPGVKVKPEDETGAFVSYFYGRNEPDWRTGIPTTRAVRYENIYDGIDLRVYGTGRQVEYDWIVQPGAKPEHIRLVYEGVLKAGLDREGNLAVETREARIVHRRPTAYQVVGNERRSVEASFRETDKGDYGFAVGVYDPSRELVIDPLVLVTSTYLGGSDSEAPYAVALDSAGAVYVAGYTRSADFPPTVQKLPRQDIFVTKFAPGGRTLVYSAFFPYGLFSDFCMVSMAVDVKGAVYLTGKTESRQFPLKNALQTTLKGKGDAVILKLAPSGKSLVYSSYLGGSSEECGFGLAVDADGAAYIGGFTFSKDFPVKHAFQAGGGGVRPDGFVTKVAADGKSLVYSTYFGSATGTVCVSLAVDGAGAAYLTGWTKNHSFPLKGAFQKAFGGGSTDAFVAKLAPTGDSLVFSSYLGGTGYDSGWAVAVDGAGAAYIAGATDGSFPVHNAFQKTRKGGYDGFVAKVALDGKSLVYATYLGGHGDDQAVRIAVDETGAAYVAGQTESVDFPVKNPYQMARKGSADGYLTIVAPTGQSLILSTFLGGMYREACSGIALDGQGSIYLVGETNSPDFPVFYPYQKSLKRDTDVFLTIFSTKSK
jgi:hypothetical protein